MQTSRYSEQMVGDGHICFKRGRLLVFAEKVQFFNEQSR